MNFVKIPYPQGEFEIMDAQVTQEEWKQVMGENPSHFKGENLPVEQVSWNDCKEFIAKLNAHQKDHVYRLPTEKEWEFACGEDPENLSDHAWFYENSKRKTHFVKQKKPNEFGLYDMLGNVWEWCEDLYYPDSGSYRVLRGGGWRSDALLCRSAQRGSLGPEFRYFGVGFRLVRTLALVPLTLDPLSSYKTERALCAAKKALEEIVEILKK